VEFRVTAASYQFTFDFNCSVQRTGGGGGGDDGGDGGGGDDGGGGGTAFWNEREFSLAPSRAVRV